MVVATKGAGPSSGLLTFEQHAAAVDNGTMEEQKTTTPGITGTTEISNELKTDESGNITRSTRIADSSSGSGIVDSIESSESGGSGSSGGNGSSSGSSGGSISGSGGVSNVPSELHTIEELKIEIRNLKLLLNKERSSKELELSKLAIEQSTNKSKGRRMSIQTDELKSENNQLKFDVAKTKRKLSMKEDAEKEAYLRLKAVLDVGTTTTETSEPSTTTTTTTTNNNNSNRSSRISCEEDIEEEEGDGEGKGHENDEKDGLTFDRRSSPANSEYRYEKC